MTEINKETGKKTGAILVVDDESNILSSLKRLFNDSNIKIYTAENAQAGMEILASETINIVLTDYRMPGMDGMQFLNKVRDNYPAVYRIIFSGFFDTQILRKAIICGWASIYFTKPWDDLLLKNRLLHILKVINSLPPGVMMKINLIQNLPSPPALYNAFSEAIKSDLTKNEIINIINLNPALYIKVLHMANSLASGNSGTYFINNAVTDLKFATLREMNVYLDITLQSEWDDERVSQLEELCLQSLLLNKYLDRFYPYLNDKKMPVSLSSIGFTYNCGQILILSYFPEQYKKARQYQAAHPGIAFYESELKSGFINTLSSKLGYCFLDMCNFPQLFVYTTLYQYDYNKAPQTIREALSTINYANRLIELLVKYEIKKSFEIISDYYEVNDEIKKLSYNIIQDTENFREIIKTGNYKLDI